MLLSIFSTTFHFRGSPRFHPQIFRRSDGWILVDFLHVILHIMYPQKPLRNHFLQFFPVWTLFWRRFVTRLDKFIMYRGLGYCITYE